MATQNHVFGPCIPQTSTGSAGAFEPLGVTLDGGTIRIEYLSRPKHTDVGGPDAPVDFQQMGARAVVRFTLINPDELVVSKIKVLAAAGGAGAEGAPGQPGTFLAASGSTFGLYLPSASASPWYFPTCRVSEDSIMESTEFSGYEVTIEPWRYVAASAGTVAGTVLYKRTAPP